MTSPISTQQPIDHVLFELLRDSLHGPLLLPGDPGYDAARRVYNPMVDRRPIAIAQPLDAGDVAAGIRFAVRHGLELTVCGGGHNIAGNAVRDGALMIDLSRLTRLDVDADGRVAHVGGGVRLGELIEATERHGLVTPTGTDSDTGVGGLTLGGGYGFLYGKHGMAVDQVLGVEIVLADGHTVRADAANHPDLFWAVRGGGGNFGVVTQFELRLHELQQTLSGMLVYPFAMAKEVLRYNRVLRGTAPDELTAYAALSTLPDGQKVVVQVLCWSGEVAAGERFLAPIRAFGPPLADLIRPMPYAEVNTLLASPLSVGARQYWKQVLLPDIADGVIDAVVRAYDRSVSGLSVVAMTDEHGAGRRVAPDATAFPHRGFASSVAVLSRWFGPEVDASNIEWTRELAAALAPFSDGSRYVNEADDEPVATMYRGNLARLREIKRRYDPDNVFRANQNIEPA